MTMLGNTRQKTHTGWVTSFKESTFNYLLDILYKHTTLKNYCYLHLQMTEFQNTAIWNGWFTFEGGWPIDDKLLDCIGVRATVCASPGDNRYNCGPTARDLAVSKAICHTINSQPVTASILACRLHELHTVPVMPINVPVADLLTASI